MHNTNLFASSLLAYETFYLKNYLPTSYENTFYSIFFKPTEAVSTFHSIISFTYSNDFNNTATIPTYRNTKGGSLC